MERVRRDIDGFGAAGVTVVATGHTAPLILPETHTVDRYEEHLTLDGLRLVYERNRADQRGKARATR